MKSTVKFYLFGAFVLLALALAVRTHEDRSNHASLMTHLHEAEKAVGVGR
jgi:hypothetical protein